MTVQRWLLWLGAGAVLGLAFASQSWRIGIGERGVRVEATFDNDGQLVLTSSWCDSGESSDIRSMSVVSLSMPQKTCNVFFCGVDCEDGDKSVPIRGRWLYGTVPAGYVADGECPAIEARGEYKIRLGGRMSGEIEFKVSNSRQVVDISRSCHWWWNW